MQNTGVQENKKSWCLPAMFQLPHILLALAHKVQNCLTSLLLHLIFHELLSNLVLPNYFLKKKTV